MGETSSIGPRALQAWTEGVTDKEVLMSWWGGLICAVVASIISYYCVAKYADFLAVMRAKATTLQQLKETPESESEEGSYVEERRSPRSISGRVRVVTIKCSAIVVFFFGLVAFVVLDLASLATLPLNLVVPTVMLFIVWGTLYQLKVSLNRTQFLVSHGMRRGMAVLLLVFVAVGTGPKVLYRVYILNKLIWDVKTIAYTVSFCFVALLLHMLRWSPRMAMYVLHVTGLCEGDVHTIIRALLAGTLGGQGLVLLKIVAEFSENAIFDREEFKVSPATILVMVVAVVATLMHVYSFHQMLNGRGRANVKLLVPVYRFALLVSGSIGAVVYLGEWSGAEATMFQTGVYWIALVGLAVICLNDAYEALRDVQVRERPECDLETGATTGTENLGQSASQTPGASNEGQSSLWDLGEGACRLRGTTEVYEDDMFYIASSRSLFGKPQVSPEKCKTKPATRHLEVVSPSDTNLPLPALNFDYPAVERSMLSELGKENPHANGPNQGRWSDPGSQKGLWKVRGKTYLHDKVKVSAGATMMKVAGLQWSYNPKNLVSCIGGEPGEFVQRFHAGRKDRPFMLVINFTVPSLGNHCMYLVPRDGLQDKRFFQMLDSFVNSPSDASRNERFKFIPSVLEGSYFVRRAVGHTPALLANKLTTKYYASWDREKTSISTATARGHWFEISVDVGSSLVARSIMGTVKSYASNLVLRFAYLIQSNSDEELPERVLAGVDFHRPVTSPKPNVSLINPASPSLESPAKNASGDSSSIRPTLSTLGAQSKEQLPTHRASSPNEMDTESNFELFVRDGVFDEVGYDTDCSFRSLMDDEDEPEAGASQDAIMLNDSDEGFVEARSEPQVENEALDLDYPVPEGTMVVPKDHPNPHASVGKSFYVDSGLKAGGWNIRGPTYNVDRIKVPCEESRMLIAAMDWHYAPDEPIHHISAMPGGFIEKHHAGREDRPFLLVINFLVPSVGNFVTYLRRNTDILDPVFDEMLAAFIHNEDDNYRKERLKLIPGVLEGSYFVRKAVGAKPALLCKKLATDFYRGDNYFEVNIDVGSTVIGSRIFSAVKGFASSLVLHLGVALESKTRRELPERLLFGIDVYRPVMRPGNEFAGALVQT